MDGLGRGELGILVQDVRRHGVGEALDDAGDEEKEAPQEDQDEHQDHGTHFIPVVAKIQCVLDQLVVSVHMQAAETVQIGYHHREKQEYFQQQASGRVREEGGDGFQDFIRIA